jgi:hypothetical protein
MVIAFLVVNSNSKEHIPWASCLQIFIGFDPKIVQMVVHIHGQGQRPAMMVFGIFADLKLGKKMEMSANAN